MSKSKDKYYIDGMSLPPEDYWMKDVLPYSGKTAEGVVLLMAVYNSEKTLKIVLTSIERLNPLPEKVIFCENNSNDKTLEIINNWNFPHEVIRVWFVDKPEEYGAYYCDPIAHARQLLLTRARHLNLKTAIFIDDDIVPERRDFIQRFLDNKLDICGGMYLRFFPKGLYVASKWDVNEFFIEELPHIDPEFVERIRKNSKYHYLCFDGDALEMKLYKVTMTSGGALALSRKVLDDRRMNFYPVRHDLTSDKIYNVASEDFSFCLLAWTLGYIVYLDRRIPFSHIFMSGKNRQGTVDFEGNRMPFSY